MNVKNWIAVASAGHVRLGRSGGFTQLCHGKTAPLRRIKPGHVTDAMKRLAAFSFYRSIAER